MSTLSITVEEIFKEIETCELVAGLATDSETRRVNHERAAKLRELADRAKQIDHEEDQQGDRSDGRRVGPGVAEREAEARKLRPGMGRQSALRDVQQLRDRK